MAGIGTWLVRLIVIVLVLPVVVALVFFATLGGRQIGETGPAQSISGGGQVLLVIGPDHPDAVVHAAIRFDPLGTGFHTTATAYLVDSFDHKPPVTITVTRHSDGSSLPIRERSSDPTGGRYFAQVYFDPFDACGPGTCEGSFDVHFHSTSDERIEQEADVVVELGYGRTVPSGASVRVEVALEP